MDFYTLIDDQGYFYTKNEGWQNMLNHLLTTNELKVEEVYQILADAQSFADGINGVQKVKCMLLTCFLKLVQEQNAALRLQREG